MQTKRSWIAFICAAGLVAGAFAAFGQAPSRKAFTMLASYKADGGKEQTVKVEIVLDRLMTADERQTAIEALKSKGSAGLKEALAKVPALGYIAVNENRTPIHFAWTRDLGGGTLYVMATNQAIGHIGSKKKGAKSTEGYDLAYIDLSVNAAGKGDGTVSPAATVKLTKTGDGIEVEDYAVGTVWLKNVEPIK